MDVKFHSWVLGWHIAGLLGSDAPYREANVFYLLKHIDRLRTSLQCLREKNKISNPHEPTPLHDYDKQLEAKLNLLVEDFLEDSQVFESFGFDNLHEYEYLDYETWMQFPTLQIALEH